ncbi:phosphatases II [Irpex rosettiformis]|uniref:Phosphatases II n=1 Tax=Irpex rosettiformis TaxID=378272 RepID=A0ACB8U4F6_9APHY|nr:phosphatases II [Irpex rosettiformis]
MADFIRRMVSGHKARFRDEELDLELDLAYITDRVIVMGYPSKGVEGFYRNRREDAKKFLEHRHGKNFWVFNFCPVKENSYSASFFDGRVSRYPFPDHHAPPLAILALVAREMRAWLDGSPDRVAVLHCKAGKGRSGTMACSYLLTLSDAPKPPSVGRSRSAQETAKQRAEQLMNSMPADLDANSNNNTEASSSASSTPPNDPVKREIATPEPQVTSGTADGVIQPKPHKAQNPVRTNSLQHVLDLHTAGRMKRLSSPASKVKLGVSIPSQRRWLYYWSLLIAHQGPPRLWSLNPEEREPPPKVQLVQIRLRMRELSAWKVNLVKAANAFIDKTSGKGKTVELPNKTHAWASLARYDDELVDTLERWERVTRSEDGEMGLRKPGSESQGDEELSEVFGDDRWDKGKMVRPFARLGADGKDAEGTASEKESKIVSFTLRPLSKANWESIRTDIEKDPVKQDVEGTVVEAEEASIHDVTDKGDSEEGIVLDANREVRVKLHIGQVFMCWFWLIPTFHMSHPSPTNTTDDTVTFHLTRSEVDFPIGIGANLIDVDVTMKWCSEVVDLATPPERQDSVEPLEGDTDPDGSATAVQALASGQVGDAVEASQVGKE